MRTALVALAALAGNLVLLFGLIYLAMWLSGFVPLWLAYTLTGVPGLVLLGLALWWRDRTRRRLRRRLNEEEFR